MEKGNRKSKTENRKRTVGEEVETGEGGGVWRWKRGRRVAGCQERARMGFIREASGSDAVAQVHHDAPMFAPVRMRQREQNPTTLSKTFNRVTGRGTCTARLSFACFCYFFNCKDLISLGHYSK